MPGMTSMKKGSSLQTPATMQPALAWVRFFEARVRWTMTWSAHQYQTEVMIMPVKTPVQGMSPVEASRKRWPKSSLGRPQD